MKEGDIYHWSYTDKELQSERRKLESRSGTLYWCCSRIAVVSDGVLKDTYWHRGSSNNEYLMPEDIDKVFELKYLGNFSELREAKLWERGMYLDEDCLDLNHKNSTRGNFYIKKDAKPSLEKMKRILRRDTKRIQNKIQSELNQIELNTKQLEEISEGDRLSVSSETCLYDEHYLDE